MGCVCNSLRPLIYSDQLHVDNYRFGGISVRKTCNRVKFSVREMSSRAFVFGEIKMTFWAQK